MKRECITSGSPYEKPIGFSRAVKIENIIAISGTAPIAEDGSTAYPNDLYNQTKFCLEIIKKTIEKAHGKIENMIRTRIFLKDIEKWEEAAKAHGEYFSEIKPACSFIGVNRFINKDWLVEIEADCAI